LRVYYNRFIGVCQASSSSILRDQISFSSSVQSLRNFKTWCPLNSIPEPLITIEVWLTLITFRTFPLARIWISSFIFSYLSSVVLCGAVVKEFRFSRRMLMSLDFSYVYCIRSGRWLQAQCLRNPSILAIYFGSLPSLFASLPANPSALFSAQHTLS